MKTLKTQLQKFAGDVETNLKVIKDDATRTQSEVVRTQSGIQGLV